MSCNCGNKSGSITPQINTIVCSDSKSSNTCKKDTSKQCTCGGACVEDHNIMVEKSVYTTTVECTHAWSMPASNDCVQLHLKDVINILPNAILYNKSVGYLHVSSYDSISGYVLACNKGEDDNVLAGTTFPSCLSFQVGIPAVCDCNSDYSGSCLAADLISPDVNGTTNIVVNTVTGLFVGDVISIAGYMYRITVIIDANTITIRNEGFGAPVGTVIKNDPECTGKTCTVKITVVSSDDPCLKNSVNSGNLLVCNSGTRTTIEGTADSQLLLWDNTDETWKLKTVHLTDVCTYNTVEVTLDPNVTVYLFQVNNSTGFTAGDDVYVGDLAFTVTTIVSSTSMRLTIVTAPTATSVLPVGTSICYVGTDCCNQVEINRQNIISLQAKDAATVDSNSWVPASLSNMSLSIVDTYEDATTHVLKTTSSSSTVVPYSYTRSISIASPINPSGKNLSLTGTIYIEYYGLGFNKTRYAHAYNTSTPPSNFSSYSFVSSQVNCNMSLYGNIAIDGVLQYSNTLFYTNIGFNGMPNTSGNTRPSQCKISQNITIPVSVTLTSTAHTITIPITISCLNAQVASSSEDDEVKANIQHINITTALQWVLK